MPEFPYVLTSSKSSRLFAEIRDRGVPPKVTRAWLEAAGFKSKNDRAFVGMLKFLGVISSSGEPTELYNRLRVPDWPGHLGDLIRASYSDIFSDYENAQLRTKQQIVDQMRTIDSSASSNVLELKATTFGHLCGLAQFSEGTSSSGEVQVAEPVTPEGGHSGTMQVKRGEPNSHLTVNVNISLEIPAVEDQKVYDALFESMAKHIGTLLAKDVVG